METIRLGVRQLIEFVMRSGDIDSSYRSNQRMQEGIRAHQRIQAAYGRGYQKEVAFKDTTVLEGIAFEVDGRADGVFRQGRKAMIDEIKSTSRPLEELAKDLNPLHWAQAKCYAHFYCKQFQEEGIDVQLTYVNLDDKGESQKFKEHFSAQELEDFYHDLLRRYLAFSRLLLEWKKERQASLSGLSFPYPSYRPGQRKLAVGVYEAIEREKALFVEAPTGIGKTMSVLFPALMSMGELGTEKVYYLTAKGSAQREPEKAVTLLQEEGMRLKLVQLTAKEKICLNDRLACDPRHCPYAKGHFDRVNEAILAIYQAEDRMGQEVLEDYAHRYRVCPHELQLDMANYADLVLCDYNYFFDPQVFLREAFDSERADSVILVDEAHNLIDRGREMYSAQLKEADFRRMQAVFKGEKGEKVRQQLGEAIQAIDQLAGQGRESLPLVREEAPDMLSQACQGVTAALDPYLSKEGDDPAYEEVQSFFFDLIRFSKMNESWMDGFLTLIQPEEEGVAVKIQCMDTSELFQAQLKRVKAAVFFSATLSPLPFYLHFLGGGKEALSMRLDSPFPPENLSIYQLSISTRWRDRQASIDPICRAVHRWAGREEGGNHMVFFPSYSYLAAVSEHYQALFPEELIIQSKELTGGERKKILGRYQEERGLLGFFVLGGLFAEGIDLPGEALTACCIVSVGLPGLSFEKNVIRRYFDQRYGRGFDYTYTYPGLNKVLQAAGRLIRSPEDRGSLLLIDDRFALPAYRKLFPRHWTEVHYFASEEEMEEAWAAEDKEGKEGGRHEPAEEGAD